MIIFLLLALYSTNQPTEDQAKLLQVFREEFVEIIPGHGKHAATFKYQGKVETALPQALSVAKYEVPQNLWQAVMGENPSRWKGDRNSVEMLSFVDAVDFCDKATELMRQAKLIGADQFIRLPTEIEWEYVARAGTGTVYSFGDQADLLGDYGWFHGNAAGNDPPVGAKKENPWGLYDVHGYLWEWCVASSGDKSLVSLTEEDWKNLDAGEQQALRSGSWKDDAPKLACAFRRLEKLATKDDAVGLRCVLVSTSLGEVGQADAFQPTAQAEFVDAASKLELLWCDGEFTEGPAAAADGTILFSDIGDRIMKYDPNSKQVTVFREPSGRANGLMFDRAGNLFACEGANTGGGRRISVSKPGEVEARTLTDSYEGQRFNSPNDLAIDVQGRIYFSDPRYVGDEPRELDIEVVFLVHPDGQTVIATKEVTKPNGILVSVDGKQLFVSEHHPTNEKQLLKFDIQPDGTLENKSVLYDFGKGRGIDGMTMDVEGNIYATAGDGEKSGIYVFGADGKQLAMIKLPGAPTNCVFGKGRLAKTLFITSAGPADAGGKYGLYAIELKKKGFHIADQTE